MGQKNKYFKSFQILFTWFLVEDSTVFSSQLTRFCLTGNRVSNFKFDVLLFRSFLFEEVGS